MATLNPTNKWMYIAGDHPGPGDLVHHRRSFLAPAPTSTARHPARSQEKRKMGRISTTSPHWRPPPRLPWPMAEAAGATPPPFATEPTRSLLHSPARGPSGGTPEWLRYYSSDSSYAGSPAHRPGRVPLHRLFGTKASRSWRTRHLPVARLDMTSGWIHGGCKMVVRLPCWPLHMLCSKFNCTSTRSISDGAKRRSVAGRLGPTSV